MINVNVFFNFIGSVTNKAENGSFSIPQFNSALPIVVKQYIDKCIKTLRDYQLGQNKNFALIADAERALFDITVKSTINVSGGIGTLPNDWDETKGINYNYTTQNPLTIVPYPVREVSADEFAQYKSSQLNTPTKKHAIATYYDNTIRFAPSDILKAELLYYKSAPNPVWAFTVENGVDTYDATTSVNISLGENAINELAYMFCQYLGLSIKDSFIEQFSQRGEAKSDN